MEGPPLWLIFMSPEALTMLGVIILIACYIYVGWYLPISRIRDPKVKTKTGWVMLLLILGVAPILTPIIMGVVSARRNAAQSVGGTSLNASPGPQPVAVPNEMRGAVPANRPSAAY